ncbi:MAG: thiamine biosynthesis protein ThiJ [Desulfobulbaceae bacterium A2]|nr:MAG: thiamine biosynthesis protein ThiJ [Desulfobulbaceae bacterium A2]
MALKTAFLVFDGVAELDFVAPKDVFFASSYLGHQEDVTYTVSATGEPITCLGGLKLLPDYSFATAPRPDILFVPGTADPSPHVQNRQLLEWVKSTSAACLWTAGVCTGAAILLASGVAVGKRITTHWGALEELRKMGGATVLDGVRYVTDGNLITSAGVTAGIDQALWLVGQLYGAAHAHEVQHLLDYYPEPPYAAVV